MFEIKINNVIEIGIGIIILVYRNDVICEVDVIEEVLCVYGYNCIKIFIKFNVFMVFIKRIEDYKV